jgi:hypothetical protein
MIADDLCLGLLLLFSQWVVYYTSGLGALDESHSAKHAQRSSHTGPPGYLWTRRFQPIDRVSTEVTFWHSAEYGSDFRCNSGEIPRNSAEFRGISPELRRNHFRSQKIPRNSVSAEFRGHPTYRLADLYENSAERA